MKRDLSEKCEEIYRRGRRGIQSSASCGVLCGYYSLARL